MRFSYLARDAAGSQVEGFIEAASEQAAVRRLTGDGVRVIDLKPADPEAGKKKRVVRAIGAAQLEQPLSELAILLGGGVQAFSACESVARTADSPNAQACFQAIADRLRIGENFADAFAESAPNAPAAIKAIIRAGDASGALGPAVKEAAESLAFQGGLQRDIVSSLIYPAVLLVAGVGAAGFMTMNVIPKFASTLGDRVQGLPAFTQAVFALSIWMQKNAPIVVTLAGASVFLITQGLRQRAVRQAIADLAVQTPFLSGFMLSFESARWAGLFAAMIGRRTPLLEALAIAREGFASGRLQRQMLQAERAIRRGDSIAQSLAAHTSLPATLINLIAAGESSGDLAGSAKSAALVFQDRARTTGKRVAALIEPATVLIIGGFIGALAVTMLTAINSVTANAL